MRKEGCGKNMCLSELQINPDCMAFCKLLESRKLRSVGLVLNSILSHQLQLIASSTISAAMQCMIQMNSTNFWVTLLCLLSFFLWENKTVIVLHVKQNYMKWCKSTPSAFGTSSEAFMLLQGFPILSSGLLLSVLSHKAHPWSWITQSYSLLLSALNGSYWAIGQQTLLSCHWLMFSRIKKTATEYN